MDNMERINEQILQQRQEEYTAEDYQREIVRLRAQLSASQQGEKLALEQLVAQQSHVAPSSSQMMPQSLQQ